MKYIYEFTNGRKLTKREFLHWFEKKFLYSIRKFEMIDKKDTIGYQGSKDFRNVVLENLLKMFVEKSFVELVKLPSKKKVTKIAVAGTTDSEANEVIQSLFKKDLSKLNIKPVEKNIIKPLYLFLDKEVLLYAKLKGLKFTTSRKDVNKISLFVESLEKKHPEIKHAIVNSYLELFN